MKAADLRPADLELVHQLVWLMNEYPGKTINDFAKTFLVPEMPIYEINTGFWRARDLGYIVLDDSKFDGTGTYKVDRVPEKWQFGERVEALLEGIPYLLKCLNEDEGDIENGQLQSWFIPKYNRYEVGLALKKLEDEKVIAQYDVTVKNEIPVSKKAKGRGEKPEFIKDTYIYYTLFENLEQLWGRKQHPDQSMLE